jgi:hypothetical protein
LMMRRTSFLPILLERGSDPGFVNRIHMDALRILLFHGDDMLDVLKLLFNTSRYYINLSVSEFYKPARLFGNSCNMCCAYVDAVRCEQRSRLPVMNRLGALLAPRQYALSLPEKKKNELAEQVRAAFGVYAALRRVFFLESSASRLPPVIGSVVAAFLVYPAAELAALRELRLLF